MHIDGNYEILSTNRRLVKFRKLLDRLEGINKSKSSKGPPKYICNK